MDALRRIARGTGIAYLALAVTGMLGFLIIRPRLFVADHPAATLANLQSGDALARWGIALELGVVLTQALAALGFFRLFRPVDATAAGAVAAFGLVNSTAVLGSAAMLAAARGVAQAPAGIADPAGLVQTLYRVSDGFWAGGNLFFGLWLIPLGYLAVTSVWMPRLLGRILVVGGVGYTLSGFVLVLAPGAPGWLEQVLVAPATVGEFWMVGYLLVRGIRRGAAPAALERVTVAA